MVKEEEGPKLTYNFHCTSLVVKSSMTFLSMVYDVLWAITVNFTLRRSVYGLGCVGLKFERIKNGWVRSDWVYLICLSHFNGLVKSLG